MEQKAMDVGQVAPDFSLNSHKKERITLSDYRNKKVVLSFHPLAWTGVCKLQMQGLEKARPELTAAGAVGFGISVDSVPCKNAWAEAIQVVETPLLADFWPHGGIAIKYGILREAQGFSERSVIIVDQEGIIRFEKIYPIDQVPDMDEILKALQGF